MLTRVVLPFGFFHRKDIEVFLEADKMPGFGVAVAEESCGPPLYPEQGLKVLDGKKGPFSELSQQWILHSKDI